MLHDLAVSFRLTLSRAAQHRKELADRFHRQDRLQKQNCFAYTLQVYVEVGPGEAEYDADVAFGQHDGIHENAAVRIFERDDQWHQEPASNDSSYEVGPGDLVKHRPDHFHPLHGASFVQRMKVRCDFVRYIQDALVEITPR